MHRWLSFSSSDDDNTLGVTPSTPRATSENTQVNLENKEEEEDFQTVPLDDDHWTDEQIPNRTLCIHSHLLQHELCMFPCPYADYLTSSYLNELDLSDISEFEDYMVTSSDEDIPSLED